MDSTHSEEGALSQKDARPLGCNVVDLTSKAIGDFGKWQFWICLSMSLLKLPLAWYQLNIIFLAPPQEYWCEKPEEFSHISDEEWRELSSPKVEEHPCFIFDPKYVFADPSVKLTLPLVACKKFVYNKTVFPRTITSDWNLVCSRHWLIHLSQVVLMWGVLVGSIVFGVLADKYGRKLPLMICIIIQCVSSYIASILPWFWVWLVNWFILALGSGGIGVISFVICVEVVNGKWRTTIPVLYQLPFGLGSAVMAGLAYWLRDWRKLEFALATLSAFFILYWFWIPESPRWLLATGQTEKALEILKKAALKNNIQCNWAHMEHLLSDCKGQKRNDPGFMAFFKSKNMRQKTVLLSINWFFTGLAFFTFSQYIGLIGENIFMTVALSGLISIPGSLLCVYIVTATGRKITLMIFQLTTALCFIGIWLVPREDFTNDWFRLLFAGTGFAGMSGTVAALYLFSGELYPTVGRNVGIGGVTTFARIAAMVAPGIVSLDDRVPDLPVILLAITTFAQTLLIMPLPETKDYPLPDTLDQAEQFTKHTKKINTRS